MLFAPTKKDEVVEQAKELQPNGHDIGEQARHFFDALRGKAEDAGDALRGKAEDAGVAAAPVWSYTSDFVAGQVERGGKSAVDLSSKVTDTAGDYGSRAARAVAAKGQDAADVASKVVTDVAASAAAAKKAAGKELARRRPGADRGPSKYAWAGLGAATIVAVVAVLYRRAIWSAVTSSPPYQMVRSIFIHEEPQPQHEADGTAEMEMEA